MRLSPSTGHSVSILIINIVVRLLQKQFYLITVHPSKNDGPSSRFPFCLVRLTLLASHGVTSGPCKRQGPRNIPMRGSLFVGSCFKLLNRSLLTRIDRCAPNSNHFPLSLPHSVLSCSSSSYRLVRKLENPMTLLVNSLLNTSDYREISWFVCWFLFYSIIM